ncbi:MAG: sugar ABC transporter permease, partial [Chloroflexota bacterium]
MSFVDEVASARKGRRVRWRDMSPLKRDEAKWGYFFISLWIIGFLAFYLVPMLASFWFSLIDFQLANPGDIEFVGFENWRRMLFEDELVWLSVRVTLVFALISLPIGLFTA